MAGKHLEFKEHEPEEEESALTSPSKASRRKWRRPLSPMGRMYQSFASMTSMRRNSSGDGSLSFSHNDGDNLLSPGVESRDTEDDLARPCGMAKSIIGLLTTASVYAGMGDLEQAESICEENGEEEVEVEEEEEDEEEEDEEEEDEEEEEEQTGEKEDGGVVREKEDTSEKEETRAKEDEVEFQSGRRSSEEDSKKLETAVHQSPLALEPGQGVTRKDSLESFGDSYRTSSSEDSITHASKKDSLFEISVVPNFDAQSVATTSSRSRHSKIYEKLLSKFNLNEEEDQFISKYSCWLLKDLLIQGHILLTTRHLLFFAFLPKNTGTPKMVGNLSTVAGGLRGRRTRHWAVLKDHTLSLYNSPKDLYFPILTIDLRYATRIDLLKHDDEVTGDFKIITETKSFKFRADSKYASRSWCSALKKQLFATQNSENDSMSVKIPLTNIIDIDEQILVARSLTLRIRVLESAQSFAVDDYFFMFLNKKGIKLKEAINAAMGCPGRESSDGGNEDAPLSDVIETKLRDDSSNDPVSAGVRGRSLSNSKKLFKRVLSPVSRANMPSIAVSLPFTSKSTNGVKGRLRSITGLSVKSSPSDDVEERVSAESPNVKNSQETNDYHPASSADEVGTFDEDNGRNFRLANWTPKHIRNMGSMWSAHPVHYQLGGMEMFPDDDQYLASGKDQALGDKRFKSHFSLGENEFLRAAYYAHLNKNIPIYGKLYLGISVICFRSLIPGNKTKMILPIADVENCYKERGFRFGYFGLVLVIHGHEELFFEFSIQSARDDAEFVILKQLDAAKSLPANSSPVIESGQKDPTSPSASDQQALADAAKLRLFEDKINAEGYDVPLVIEESPYYKTSITPKKSYKFGLLTIGSRGDVQPYIALGKGLIKEGHRVTIITHAEFGDWIKSYGLGFREIAGNPAKLMSLMVQHGSMNVGLIREASSHFRGWIKELLESSWSACQDLDILIESPSAMAGIHIAEALKIPYFRAFTMPWTRTRAYPHAFIVPDQKRGGNYNYFTHVLFENIFWKGVGGQVNKWRTEKLGLEKTNLFLMQQNKVPFLYNISPAIFPPSVDFSEWVKVTGYWFLDGKDDYEPPQALKDFISRAKISRKKLVYIGFGSIVISDPKEMTKAVIDAILEADVYCILNKGWSDRFGGEEEVKSGEEEQFPDCIYNSGSVPHDWLFPQVDAAVHHGGSGTTGATLRAGVPTVIKPFFGDQFFYAGRVEDIGAGISLKKLNSKSLSRALKEVTTNSRIIQKAQQMKLEIAKEDGVSVAIGCIYSELEYARSLVADKTKTSKMVTKEPSSPEENAWFIV